MRTPKPQRVNLKKRKMVARGGIEKKILALIAGGKSRRCTSKTAGKKGRGARTMQREGGKRNEEAREEG